MSRPWRMLPLPLLVRLVQGRVLRPPEPDLVHEVPGPAGRLVEDGDEVAGPEELARDLADERPVVEEVDLECVPRGEGRRLVVVLATAPQEVDLPLRLVDGRGAQVAHEGAEEELPVHGAVEAGRGQRDGVLAPVVLLGAANVGNRGVPLSADVREQQGRVRVL